MSSGIRGRSPNFLQARATVVRAPSPNSIVALIACATLAGCAGLWDVHGPKTVVANASGGAVTVEHGDRLRLPLATEAGYEWRKVEPQILTVVAEGPADAEGLNFTPVRTGTEQLRLEYRPLAGDGTAQKSVAYDVTVPEDAGLFSGIWNTLRGNRRRK